MGPLAILGSTGFLGRTVLEVCATESLSVAALAAGSNLELLADQIERFRPTVVSVAKKADAARLARLVSHDTENPRVRIDWGEDGLCEAAAQGSTVVVVLSKAAGLKACVETVSRGADLVVGSKEIGVCAGKLLRRRALQTNGRCVPLDSELTAVTQLLEGKGTGDARRVVLSASGGPFWKASEQRLAVVTPQEATAHPVWPMGAKVSVDSATMMNKAMELMVAHQLLGIDTEKLDVVVHPQCRVHAMVEWWDGTVAAHIAEPDMRWAVTRTLGMDRPAGERPAPLALSAFPPLSFHDLGGKLAGVLRLAWRALSCGGLVPAVLSSVDEIAVQAFLDGKIPFLGIRRCLEDLLEQGIARWSRVGDEPELDTIKEALEWGRAAAGRWVADAAPFSP
jgi:1-deoxy-D-xylulose-5-phosphate reductoisomerase